MKTPAYIKDPQIQPLFQLLEEIRDGLVRIPKFQRPVVWSDDQRLELLRSVSSGTPIGSIMLWRTHLDLATFDRLGPLAVPESPSAFRSYVLDGHQRLSTLAGALLPVGGSDSQGNVEDQHQWEIFYDLEDEEFVFQESPANGGNRFFPLRLALDTIGRMRFQLRLAEADEGVLERSEAIASAIYNFKIPILPVVTDEVDQATRIFQRINSTGTDMNPVHMIHALTWKAGFSLNEKLSELREEVLGEKSWRGGEEMLDQMIVSACKANLELDIYEGDIDVISQRLTDRPEALAEAARYVASALDFLSEHCGIKSSKVLPYSMIAPMLAVGLKRFEEVSVEKETTHRQLRYWLWWTLYVGLAGGSNSSRIRRATNHIRTLTTTGLEAQSIMPPAGELAPLPPRFDFRHARTKLLSLRMADWLDGTSISEDSAVSYLNDRDAGAMQPLVLRSLLRQFEGAERSRLSKLLSSPANRIVAYPEGSAQLRQELLEESQSAKRLGHLIPTGPVPEKDDGPGWEDFFHRRMRLIAAIEYRFAADQRLLTSSPPILKELRTFEQSFEGTD